MNNLQENLNENGNSNEIDQEIDIRSIYNTVVRKKYLIFKILLVGILIGSFKALTAPKIWEGEFQIVIDENSNDKGPPTIKFEPSNLLQLQRGNNLETQITILKSPSVLMDIFQYVKSYKGLNESDIQFRNWKKSFEINLEKGTTVLNINYRDQNKDIILPVLNKISDKYQKYSGNKKLKEIELTTDYYIKEISNYKKKARASYLEAIRFGNKHEINVNQIEQKNLANGNIQIIPTDVEINKYDANQRLNFYQVNLSNIKKLKDNDTEIIAYANLFPKSSLEFYVQEIKNIDKKILIKSQVLKENDYEIKDLNKLKDKKIKLIKNELIKYLTIEIQNAEIIIENNTRSPETIIEYKRLLGKAFKDSKVLDNLEESYRLILLEKNRLTVPWELITKPTLLPNYIYPNKINILAIYSFSFLSFGILTAIFIEKYQKIIYSKNDIIKIINYPVIGEIFLIKEDSLEETILLLRNSFFDDKETYINFLFIGELDSEIKNNFKKEVDKYFSKYELIDINSIKNIDKYSNIILISQLGITTKNELELAYNKLTLYKNNIVGSLVIN